MANKKALANYDGNIKEIVQSDVLEIPESFLMFGQGSTPSAPGSGTKFFSRDVGLESIDSNSKFRMYHPWYIRQMTDRIVSSVSTLQKIFDSVSNGSATLELGLYEFRGMLYVTGMSATSGNLRIDVLGAGTAVCAGWLWQATGQDTAANGAGAAMGGSSHDTSTSATSIVTAATATVMTVYIRGMFRVTTAGTLIPSLALAVAASATVKAGTNFIIQKLGPNGDASFGSWS